MNTTQTKTRPTLGRHKAASAPRPSNAEAEYLTTKSADLFQGKRELRIQHEGREYRLRITRLNKLIMTV